MKLELKHLAPYLPYGLQLRLETKGDFQNSPNNVNILTLSCNTIQTALVEKRYRQISCNPLLIPIESMRFMELDGEETYFTIWIKKKTGFDVDTDLDFELQGKYADESIYHSLFNSIKVYNLLLEYHFDIFSLIPAGLALNKLDHI